VDENKYLELVRKKTMAALWILLLLPTILAITFGSPEKNVAVQAAILVCDAAMTTMFVMRRNWGRAVLFVVFGLIAFTALIR